MYGSYTALMEESEQVFAYQRQDAYGRFLVLVNLSDDAVDLTLPADIANEPWQAVMNNLKTEHDWLTKLQPWQAVIAKR